MNKEKKKKLLAEYKQQQKKEFEASLPITRELFLDLFDFLDQELESLTCPADFTLTISFLKGRDLYSSKIKFKPRQLYLQPQSGALSNLRLVS